MCHVWGSEGWIDPTPLHDQGMWASDVWLWALLVLQQDGWGFWCMVQAVAQAGELLSSCYSPFLVAAGLLA